MFCKATITGLFVLCACGSSLPSPALAEHPRAAYEEVPYPAPAALVETVPPQPEIDGAVWVDGEWVFRGKYYVWERGGWFVPPAGARFAPKADRYLPDGRLMRAPSGWYDAQNQAMGAPKPVAPAETPPNEVTSELQTAR